MIRLGLCCTFREQPIRFANTTATALSRMPRRDALLKLSGLCLQNAASLLAALRYCTDHGIGCFRINSQILPLKTHQEIAYNLDDLPDGPEIVKRFIACGTFARERGLRTSFHPDQFVVLNSPRAEVVDASIRELEYQGQVAEWVGADVINIHAGGAYGDKAAALQCVAWFRGRSFLSAGRTMSRAAAAGVGNHRRRRRKEPSYRWGQLRSRYSRYRRSVEF
jgi:UV DNA damage endonuclease